MKNKNTVPHNQVRHSKAKANKENSSLIQQNRELRKQLRALQRSYNRLVKEVESGRYGLVELDDLEDGDFDEIKTPPKPLHFCSKCSSEEVQIMEIQRRDGQRKYAICQSCGHREVIRPKI